ncbi:lamin tail domain-containing protein [Chryseobacterium sp. SC28]|uniref:lamin tail domain-containing protein n=1 Tax=Chryseobacterium sp. SC28 TaxID=2268028 RepID=UPI000F64D101|nr:lamin tail domain-containing protein [Chryseobacterium sp. SC28]MCG2792177.1 lamin tail domain-containing protein [Weeksellaceae bacterium]RRQ46855.1 T9SS C-terminal target domain-containing protein [Chryseobacterium sp. SC28]
MKKIFTILSIVSVASIANAQIVISEVYGGGGGATAVYINDFVELKNLGSSSATLTGATLQYASATGTFNSFISLPTVTLDPGQKFLVEMVPSSPNSAGAALPTADFQATSNASTTTGTVYQGGFNMSASNGKIVLATNSTQVASATASNVIDFVGYGTANQYEGGGAAPALDAGSSATRTAGDTNNNATDFAKLAPTPENKASLAVSDVASFEKAVQFNTIVKDQITFKLPVKSTVNIYSLDGKLISSNRVENGGSVNTQSLLKGAYIVTVDSGANKISRKVIKN